MVIGPEMPAGKEEAGEVFLFIEEREDPGADPSGADEELGLAVLLPGVGQEGPEGGGGGDGHGESVRRGRGGR